MGTSGDEGLGDQAGLLLGDSSSSGKGLPGHKRDKCTGTSEAVSPENDQLLHSKVKRVPLEFARNMPAGLYSLQKCRGPMLTNDAPGFKAILHNAFHNTLKFLKKHLKRSETHVTSKCLRVSLTALALSKGLKEWLLREVCEAGVASTSPATRSATSPSSCPLLPDSKHLPRYGKTVRFYMVLHWTWFYSTKGACLQHLKTSVS